jgi:hypothetical protein
MNKESPLYKWLKTQPKEFVVNVNNNELYGNGQFTIEELCELDKKFNPVDENND